MDGVPYLTQASIQPGGKFMYEFDAVDAVNRPGIAGGRLV
jgi:FtsP/CotA-like multicopper oxidase with cupredoxin domain